MRAAAIALVAMALVSSCTGTAGPTTSTTVSPTSAGSPSPTPMLTTISPPAGSATPTGSGSTSPTVPPGIGADTFLLRDDLETQSGWGTGDAPPTGRVEYGDGTLEMSFDIVGSIWSNRELEGRWNVLRIEGVVYLRNAAGAAGFMCGSTRSDHVGGVVNTRGRWFVVETVDGNTQQLQSGALQTPNPLGVYHLAVECAGTATGALRWRMLVDGAPVPTFERSTGPVDFDRGVAFASIGSVDFTAEFDDVVIYGGSDFIGFPSQPQG